MGIMEIRASMLQVETVDFSYPGTDVLSQVDLFLSSSEILNICGPSGCGKSTLLLLLGGLLKPTGGQVLQSPEIDSQRIIYAPQHDTLLPWLSLRRNIELGREITGNASPVAFSELAEALNIHTFLEKPVEALSGGMRKRACLVRTFYAAPAIVLLDEPFNNLDFVDRGRVELFLRQWVTREQRSVVCITHDIEQAVAFGSRVGYFHPNMAGEASSAMQFDVLDIPSTMLSLSPRERRGHQDFVPFVRQIEGSYIR